MTRNRNDLTWFISIVFLPVLSLRSLIFQDTFLHFVLKGIVCHFWMYWTWCQCSCSHQLTVIFSSAFLYFSLYPLSIHKRFMDLSPVWKLLIQLLIRTKLRDTDLQPWLLRGCPGLYVWCVLTCWCLVRSTFKTRVLLWLMSMSSGLQVFIKKYLPKVRQKQKRIFTWWWCWCCCCCYLKD